MMDIAAEEDIFLKQSTDKAKHLFASPHILHSHTTNHFWNNHTPNSID